MVVRVRTPTSTPQSKVFDSPTSEPTTDVRSKHVQWTRRRRMMRNKVGKFAPAIVISTPIFFFLCMCVIYYSLHQENNLSKLRKRQTLIKTDLIYKVDYGGAIRKKGTQALWDELVSEGQALVKENPSKVDIHVTEVGMYKPRECIKAANHGLNAHCIEPSSIANQVIMHGFSNVSGEHKKLIRFYKAAAGEETGKYVKFQSGGTQGDHVGEFMDMWTMTRKEPEQHGKAWLASKIEPFLVKTVSVDDIIDNKVKPTVDYSEGEGKKVDKMFLVKIDTQGYEPEVLKGMKKSISEHKIDFIITEYWPKGMDFMHGVKNEERCEKPAQMLKFLLDSGYILFAMPIVGHPKAPKAAKNYVKRDRGGRINFDDLKEHCEFFYEVEEKNPSEDYKMGYWTDILAVSPAARLPEEQVSELGRIVHEILNPSTLSSIW